MDSEKRWILPPMVMGHLPLLSNYLESKPKILQYINWYFRVYGAPVYMNNPISGVLIIIASYVDNHYYATSGLIGATLGFLISLCTLSDPTPLKSGGIAFNSFLVGIVLPRFVAGGSYNWKAMLVIAVLSILCAYVAVGLETIFSYLDIPTLNFAFNIIGITFVGALQGSTHLTPASTPSVQYSYSNITATNIGQGLVLGIGQTIGLSTLASGGIFMAALAVFSPLLCLQAVIASCVGLSVGLGLGADLNDIYTGQYGYNAVLTCCGLGGFFIVYGPHTQLLTILAGIFSTMLFICLQKAMDKVGLVCITLPFIATVHLFLSTVPRYRGLVKPSDISYPEQHLYEYMHTPVHPTKRETAED